jgi:hypothetical protein
MMQFPTSNFEFPTTFPISKARMKYQRIPPKIHCFCQNGNLKRTPIFRNL